MTLREICDTFGVRAEEARNMLAAAIDTCHERVRCRKCRAPIGERCVRAVGGGWRPTDSGGVYALKSPHRERVRDAGLSLPMTTLREKADTCCPACGGLHSSRGEASCVGCDNRLASACQAFMCFECQGFEVRMALSDIPPDELLVLAPIAFGLR